MNSNRKSVECDYVVIGGGIVGGCIAYYLSRNNKEVICIDSGEFSGSNSNAGSIHVQLQSRNFRLNPHLIDNLLENLPFYKEAVNAWDRLRLMLDVDFDLRVNGGLMVADNEEQMEFLYKKCQKEKAAGLIFSTSIVPKSNPKNGITIVRETKENKTVSILNTTFNIAYL